MLTEEARLAGFTNEGGVDGTTRFLSNVMGTWLLSETLRTWGETDLAGMLRAAEAYDIEVPVVDVQHEMFLPPGDMQARIGLWCLEHGVARAPRSGGRGAVHRAEHRRGRRDRPRAGRRSLGPAAIAVVHVVGGGAQNTLLCQAIADRSGHPVLAGPVEATAIGNVLVQARAADVVGPTLADLRALVARTHDLVRFEPRG